MINLPGGGWKYQCKRMHILYVQYNFPTLNFFAENFILNTDHGPKAFKNVNYVNVGFHGNVQTIMLLDVEFVC